MVTSGTFPHVIWPLWSSCITILSLLILLTCSVDGFQYGQVQLFCRCGRRADFASDTAIIYSSTDARSYSSCRRRNQIQLVALAAIPTLNKWKIIPTGSVIGTVKNHPAIADGDVITTSPIEEPEMANRQSIVTTASGSKYKLLDPRGEVGLTAINEIEAAALEAAYSLSSQSSNKQQSSSTSAGVSSFFAGWGGSRSSSKTVEDPKVKVSSDESTAEALKERIRNSSEWQEVARKYKLNGATIGLEDEYLLASKPERSTSGKSNIWEAYKVNESTGLPVDNAVPICLKISTNLEAISREYENYRKLSFLGIWETGRFVRCYEFFPVAGYDKRFRHQCALAIERGSCDLKSFLNSRGRLENKELRDACISATQCVQALHNAGLVWTDMKTENFVVMPSGEVKGIDLESAMPIGDYPVDYSPEACPPEFATAFLVGEGPYFELESSYDIWSLGMLMLELSTGVGYFDGKNPAQITKLLRDMDDSMAEDLDKIQCDKRLKDLIRRCLQRDRRKRPNTSQILLHPFFLAANPFSFLSREKL